MKRAKSAEIAAKMKQLGTYKPEFQRTVERLAECYGEMERMKALMTAADDPEAAESAEKRLMTLWDKALAMEDRLGLTPAGLKKLGISVVEEKQQEDALSQALHLLAQ